MHTILLHDDYLQISLSLDECTTPKWELLTILIDRNIRNEILTNLLSHCDQMWGTELGNNTLQHLRQENQEKPSINSTSGWNNSSIWKNAAIHYVRGRCPSKGCSFSTNACPGAKWDESGKFSSHTHKRDKHFVPRVIQIKMKMQSLFPFINLHMHT